MRHRLPDFRFSFFSLTAPCTLRKPISGISEISSSERTGHTSKENHRHPAIVARFDNNKKTHSERRLLPAVSSVCHNTLINMILGGSACTFYANRSTPAMLERFTDSKMALKATHNWHPLLIMHQRIVYLVGGDHILGEAHYPLKAPERSAQPTFVWLYFPQCLKIPEFRR